MSFESGLSAGLAQKEGDLIPVLYEPRDLSSARRADSLGVWGRTFAWGLCALLSLAASLAPAVAAYNWSRGGSQATWKAF